MMMLRWQIMFISLWMSFCHIQSQDTTCSPITSCRVYVKDTANNSTSQFCDRTKQKCGQCAVINPSLEKYPCIGRCSAENVCGSAVDSMCPPGSKPLCRMSTPKTAAKSSGSSTTWVILSIFALLFILGVIYFLYRRRKMDMPVTFTSKVSDSLFVVVDNLEKKVDEYDSIAPTSEQIRFQDEASRQQRQIRRDEKKNESSRDSHRPGGSSRRESKRSGGRESKRSGGRESKRSGDRESKRSGDRESKRRGRDSYRNGHKSDRRESKRSGRESRRIKRESGHVRESKRRGESSRSRQESPRSGHESDRSGHESDRSGYSDSGHASDRSDRSGYSDRSGQDPKRNAGDFNTGRHGSHKGWSESPRRESKRRDGTKRGTAPDAQPPSSPTASEKSMFANQPHQTIEPTAGVLNSIMKWGTSKVQAKPKSDEVYYNGILSPENLPHSDNTIQSSCISTFDSDMTTTGSEFIEESWKENNEAELEAWKKICENTQKEYRNSGIEESFEM